MAEPNTSALVYVDGDQHYYLPTDPSARSWRGPYASARAMCVQLEHELGADTYVTVTRVRPKLPKRLEQTTAIRCRL